MKADSLIGIAGSSTRWSFVIRILVLLPGSLSVSSFAASQIEVNGGSLSVGSSLSVGELHIDADSTLGGTGTIIGDVTVRGVVNPSLSGASPASLHVQGNTTFIAGSSFRCRATTHTQSDQLNVKGEVSGSCMVQPSKASGAVPVTNAVITSLSGSYNNFSLSTADAFNWRLVTLGDDLLLTDLIGDSDANGLPDWYELQYFSERTGTDPNGHGDSDRLTNEEELIAGTDPTDGSSVFAITTLSHQGGSIYRVEWPSVAGRKYSLYCRSDLMSAPVPLVLDELATPPLNSVLIDSSLDRIFIHGTVERTGGQ